MTKLVFSREIDGHVLAVRFSVERKSLIIEANGELLVETRIDEHGAVAYTPADETDAYSSAEYQAGVREGIEMAAQLLVSRAAWFPLHTIYNYNGKIMRDELLANAKLIRAILPAAPNTANEKQRAPAGDAIEQGINDAITMIRALLPTAPKEG